MKKKIIILMCLLFGMTLLTGCHKEFNQLSKPKAGDTIAEIVVRDYGTIYVKFFSDAAPKAVENFITHAKKGYYDGQSFYKIIKNSIMESGDPTGTGSGGDSIWGEPFSDEFNPDIQPYYGALCMANSKPDSNRSQFFIVQASHTFNKEVLDQIEQTYQIHFNDKARKLYGKVGGAPWFYHRNTVFAQVYKGYYVLEAIAKVKKTDAELGIPAKKVVIEKVNILKYK